MGIIWAISGQPIYMYEYVFESFWGILANTGPNTLAELAEIPSEHITIKWDNKNECIIKGDNGARKCTAGTRHNYS